MSRILAFLVTLLVSNLASAQSVILGTYNIRMETAADTGNLWIDRAPIVASLIKFHGFDIFGTQEGFRNQLDDIERQLPEYDYYGVGRDDGREKGEHSAIFYRKTRFALLDSGDFWLSPTPDKPSKGWDARCCNRLCSWVKLRDTVGGREFFVFNAHYDHEGKQARIESSKLILQKIRAIAGAAPIIFCGDLNGGQQSDPYRIVLQSDFLQDAFSSTANRYANSGTFNGFGRTIDSREIIDHIFISEQFAVSRYGILSDSYRGKFPSDHFPVLAELHWK